MDIGRIGVWAMLDTLTASETARLAQQVERWGYGALWQAEGSGRDVLVESGWLLAHTSRLVAASGIANIYARDTTAAVGGQCALAEQSGGRFLLGLGVSHAPIVAGRGHGYAGPVAAMRAYLTALRDCTYRAPPPASRPLTVIAALGPKMLALAAELADGAHPYNVTPEHTAGARRILGAGKLLCVEQKVLLVRDAIEARAIGRRVLAPYLGLANYLASWTRLGFDERDWSGGASDRLVDAMIAWGDEPAVRDRVQQHLDAGADHVCVQALHASEPVGMDVLALLAPDPA